MDGFTELTTEKLIKPEGINELNRMLQKLFEHAAGDGDTVRIYKGYGNPTIAAGDGSLYQKLDSGTLWVMESGTWTEK